MGKNVAILLGSIVIIIVLIVGGLLINTEDEVHTNTVDAVPENATIVIRCSEFTSKWNKLTHQTQIGKNLASLSFLKQYDSILTDLGKKLKQHNELLALLNSGETLISIHSTGLSTSLLYLNNCPTKSDYKSILNFINSQYPGKKSTTRKYENVEISNIIFSEGLSVSIAHSQGVVMLSLNPILVEDAIRQLRTEQKLLDNPGFQSAWKVADKKEDANVFFHYGKIPGIFTRFVDLQKIKVNRVLSEYGDWGELDITLKKEGIMMNGFSFIQPSAKHFLNSFSNQSPRKNKMIHVLPSNTSYYLYYAYQNFDDFMSGFKNHLAGKNELYNYEKQITAINTKYNLDLEKDFLSNVGYETGLILTGASAENLEKSACALIQLKDLAQTEAFIQQAMTATGSNFSEKYRGFQIRNLGLKNLIPTSMGDAFSLCSNSYMTLIEDYAVFANEPGPLKHIINSYIKKETLADNNDFTDFVNHLPSETNNFLYTNFKNTTELWKHFLNKKSLKELNKNKEIIKKLEAFGFQIGANQNMYYTNAYLKYNPNKSEITSALAEAKLDASFTLPPQIVKNHYSGKDEIFIQDKRENIYLVDMAGKVLWKRNIKGSILGHVTQVDRYKNKKLQILFTTSTHLFLIDRNGKNVEGFPIKLKAEASGPVSVMDYDQNRSYRLLIPGKDHRIYNYNISGKIVDGWKKPQMTGVVSSPLFHQVIKNKDYIIATAENGKTQAFNRKGEVRLDLIHELPSSDKYFYFEKGLSLDNNFIYSSDPTGVVQRLSLKGHLETIPLKILSENHQFLYIPQITSDQAKYVFVDDLHLYAYSRTNNLLFEHTFEPGSAPVLVKNTESGAPSHLITVHDQQNNKLHIFDKEGNVLRGFPVDCDSSIRFFENGNGNYGLIYGNRGSLYIITKI